MSASRRFLLWDHDGVLVDTERLYFEATRDVLGRVGIELSESLYLEHMVAGRTLWRIAGEQGVPDERIAAMRNERNELYRALLRTRPIEIPGVSEVLEELGSRHRMAIITTSRRHDFELIHASRDLVRHFEFVLTVEDYARAKPEPDPYLAGLARFGADAAQALALEDSARGLAAARAAGLDCLIIENEFTASHDFSGAWKMSSSPGQSPTPGPLQIRTRRFPPSGSSADEARTRLLMTRDTHRSRRRARISGPLGAPTGHESVCRPALALRVTPCRGPAHLSGRAHPQHADKRPRSLGVPRLCARHRLRSNPQERGHQPAA